VLGNISSIGSASSIDASNIGRAFLLIENFFLRPTFGYALKHWNGYRNLKIQF
jgi:hypothetical protein